MILLDFSNCLLPHVPTVANAAPTSIHLIQDRKDKLLLAASDSIRQSKTLSRRCKETSASMLWPKPCYRAILSARKAEKLCISFSQILSHPSGMNCNKREQEFGMSIRSTHRHYLLHAITKFISISQNRKLIQ